MGRAKALLRAPPGRTFESDHGLQVVRDRRLIPTAQGTGEKLQAANEGLISFIGHFFNLHPRMGRHAAATRPHPLLDEARLKERERQRRDRRQYGEVGPELDDVAGPPLFFAVDCK